MTLQEIRVNYQNSYIRMPNGKIEKGENISKGWDLWLAGSDLELIDGEADYYDYVLVESKEK